MHNDFILRRDCKKFRGTCYIYWNMKKYVEMIIFALIGIMFVYYGMIVKRVASGTKFYLVWVAMGVACFAFDLVIYFELLNKLPKGIKIGLLVMVFICAAVFGFVEGLIVGSFSKKTEKNLDYIIVLGAQVKSSGPSTVLRYRLDKALSYLEDNPDTKCIVSGGKGYNEPTTEAECMKDYLLERGIDESHIIVEDESKNTKENIIFSMKKADLSDAKVGIVTNNFHIYRGVSIAKKQGIKNASGVVAGATKLYVPNNMFREFFGIVKDKLAGNM